MSTEKKLTAVEWLVEHFKEYGFRTFEHETEIQQAKEKEKQHIIEASNSEEYLTSEFICRAIAKENSIGEQYYEETFKKD